MNNIVLLGKDGQLGWSLQRALAPLGNVTALSSHSNDFAADFTDSLSVVDTLRRLRPNIIINAAAYTAVDKAESEPEQAQLINATTVAAIAHVAQELGAWLVHYSSDYVFDGSGDQPWRETDEPAPLNVYGASKWNGDQAIQQHCQRHLIFRTSWVYATRGNNFAKTMLRLAQERTSLQVINDQFGAPTSADLLADCTAHALRQAINNPQLAGLYHLAASGCTSWYEYACLVFDEARAAGLTLKLDAPQAIASSQYPTPARRPLNSRLNTEKFRQNFGLALPDWRPGVKRMMTEVLADK